MFLHNKYINAFISSRLLTCLSGILSVTKMSEFPEQCIQMTRLKCNHKLTVFSGQPSNIINSNTTRVMPSQLSHKNRLSESLKYFTPEAHPAAGQQIGSSCVWILSNYPTNCRSSAKEDAPIILFLQ